MNSQQPTPKKKVNTAGCIVSLVVLILFVWMISVATDDGAPPLTKTQQDSADRREYIEKAFSSWDGSHHELVKYVKGDLNDPESFEHDNTVFWDLKDTVVIMMQYRAKNAFGGVIRGGAKGWALPDGTLIRYSHMND
jgi:hypothetical protein